MGPLLVPTPNWAEGVGRLLDFRQSLSRTNSLPTPELADYAALASDWAAVGEDLRSAMRTFDADSSTDRSLEA